MQPQPLWGANLSHIRISNIAKYQIGEVVKDQGPNKVSGFIHRIIPYNPGTTSGSGILTIGSSPPKGHVLPQYTLHTPIIKQPPMSQPRHKLPTDAKIIHVSDAEKYEEGEDFIGFKYKIGKVLVIDVPFRKITVGNFRSKTRHIPPPKQNTGFLGLW